MQISREATATGLRLPKRKPAECPGCGLSSYPLSLLPLSKDYPRLFFIIYLKNDIVPKLDSVKCVHVGVSQHLVLVRENQLPKAEGTMSLKEGTGRPQSAERNLWTHRLPWLEKWQSRRILISKVRSLYNTPDKCGLHSTRTYHTFLQSCSHAQC